MPAYSLQTIRDEHSGRVTVRGSLGLGATAGAGRAVVAYLAEFGYNPDTGTIDVLGRPVTVSLVGGERPELLAVAVTSGESGAEVEAAGAVESVLLRALEILRILAALAAAGEDGDAA